MLPVPLATFVLQEVPRGFLGPFFGLILLFGLLGYLFFAFCLMKIAEKTNTPNGWWGFIPILNIILILQIARKPIWWIILLFIPLVNLVIAIVVWMGVAEARGKPGWWGILMIVPIVNLVILIVLAFGD